MSVSSEKLFEQPVDNQEVQEYEQEQSVSKKTGGKVVGKTIGVLLLAGAIGFTGVVGFIHGTRAINANEVISTFQSEYESQYVCVSDEITNTKGYDYKICSGSTFGKYLEKKGIEYVKLDGEYYTSDGRDITIYTLQVTGTQTIAAQKISNGVNSMYVAPSGYVLHGSKATKQQTEIITYVASQDMDLSSDISIQLSNGTLAEKVEVLDQKTVSTKKYEALNDCDLICDVPDECQANEVGTYPAKLTLKK